MTENQEKELFNTLATLVTGVRAIQADVGVLKTDVHGLKTDVQSIKEVQSEHSRILGEHSRILGEHSRILGEHFGILNRLDAKADSIADTVMTNDKRLTVVEKDIVELRDGIH